MSFWTTLFGGSNTSTVTNPTLTTDTKTNYVPALIAGVVVIGLSIVAIKLK